MQVKIQLLHPDAIVPVYATPGASAFDLHALVKPDETLNPRRRMIPPGGSLEVFTGLAFETPPEWGLFILPRSGNAKKHGIRLANCVGLGDPDYRGEISVVLHNDSRTAFAVHHGDRIAQAVVLHTPKVGLMVVCELSQTQRGAGGFGSTGS